jgi:molybdenum cofactor cytidylyltransferase
MNFHTKTGLIILAAGASVRLGAPKQLLSFKGETLLWRVVRQSLESVCQPVVVVLGKDAEKFKDHLGEFNVSSAYNDEWEKGMGTSIKTGIEKLLEIDRETEGAVLTVCDQPFVTSEIINQLAENFYREKSLIVASAYAETLGVPALFSRELFSELTNLKNKGGAKEIIARFSDEVAAVDFPEGAIDIDTMEDFRCLEQLTGD